MSNSTSPICRCRVLYLGSAVPHITKDGLQGIQEPLRDLYPEQGPFSAKGIDSWLSVWSNGLLLENVDESLRQVTRFFNIETLHYCAAVRYVVVPGNNGERVEKFLPLDSPFARHANPNHPPLFACILRRTSGIKVLECHAFICKKEPAANALVRCCFHSYADSMQAKHLEENPYYVESRRSRSMTGLNTLEKVEVWRSNADASQAPPVTNGSVIHGSGGGPPPPPRSTMGSSTILPTRNGDQEDDNYKIWTGNAPTERELLYVDSSGTMRSLKSGSATTRSAQVKTRQMIGQARPPPPPSPSILNGKEPKGKSSKLAKPKNKKKQKDLPPIPNGSGRMMNGFRPASVIGHFQAPASVYGGSGLYTERRVKRGRPPIPGHEEPIYIPSTRPLSPVSSYQPAGFPYEQYFMQYGTAPRNRPSKGDKKIRQPHYMPQHYYQPPHQSEPPPPPPPQERPPPPDDKDQGSDDKDMDSSPFNTGIYKKKGHLNERAFSYSIRQEHRSRSNSLANLNFFANGDADIAGPSGERSRDDDRKERELAQLVSGLDLKENGDVALIHHGPETNFIRRKAPPYQR